MAFWRSNVKEVKKTPGEKVRRLNYGPAENIWKTERRERMSKNNKKQRGLIEKSEDQSKKVKIKVKDKVKDQRSVGKTRHRR